jgi:WXG100 family type VII secretion target
MGQPLGGERTLAFNAVTPELQKAATKADDAGAQLSLMLNALLDNLAPMQKGLVGAAGMSFQQVKTNINSDLVTITDSLNEVAEGIRTAGRDFDVADDTAQQEVNKAAQDAGQIVSRLRGGGA